MTGEEKDLTKQILDLKEAVVKTVSDAQKAGEVTIREYASEVIKWVANNFQYDITEGVITNGMHSQTYSVNKKMLVERRVQERLVTSSEAQKVIANLQDKGIDRAKDVVGGFVHRLIHAQVFDQTKLNGITETFLNEILQKPIDCRIRIEIQGLTLAEDRFNLTPAIIIRRPYKEDIEKERDLNLARFSGVHGLLATPSAIVEINTAARNTYELQIFVERLLVTLQLFRVGSVRYTQYEMISESVMSYIGGTLSPGAGQGSFFKYQLAKEDVEKLRKCWKTLEDELPTALHGKALDSQLNHVIFAYERYREALMLNESFERRILNIIIGLESIFTNGTSEITQLLSLRASKFMDAAGESGKEVKDLLKQGYNLRSQFVHGNPLSPKMKARIEKRFEGEQVFAGKLLDILRQCILYLLIIKKDKESVLEMLDEALVTKEGDEKLRVEVEEALQQLFKR